MRNIQKLNEIDDMINFILDLLNVKSLGDTKEENDKHIKFIYDFVINKFGFLTIEEVKEAFRMYVAKELDTKVFRMLDCVLIAEVLDQYITFRNNSLINYKPADKTPKIEVITNSNKESIVMEGVNRVYSEFKSTQKMQENIEYIFDFLVEKEHLKLASESSVKLKKYYSDKMDQAKKELIAENKNQMKIAKSKLNNSMISILNSALNELETGNSKKIFLRTKRLVLIDYFNKCIMDSKNVIF